MVQVTVKQSGGDYSSLSAAAAANATDILVSGVWTADDTSAVTFSAGSPVSITADSDSKHPGYWDTSDNHYRLVISHDAHCITHSDSNSLTIEDIAIHQNGTGSSKEGIRCGNGASNNFRRLLIRGSTSGHDQADGVYALLTATGSSDNVHTLEQCVIWDFKRGGVHGQDSAPAGRTDFDINSCTIMNCGIGSTFSGGVAMRLGSTDRPIIDVHNSLIMASTVGANAKATQAYASIKPIWRIGYSIDNDGSLTSAVDLGPSGSTRVGNLINRTPTTSIAPGAGDWAVVKSWNNGHDYRLLSSTENDAQDMHAVATYQGITIPTSDMLGITRPQNTNYDVGAFELEAASTAAAATPRFMLLGVGP